MFTVYVLYSSKFNQIYICSTSDLPNRFLSHNELATKGHTIKFRPWVIAYTEEFETKSQALKKESQLKTANGRAFGSNYVQRGEGAIEQILISSLNGFKKIMRVTQSYTADAF
jgi:putative endonuclease